MKKFNGKVVLSVLIMVGLLNLQLPWANGQSNGDKKTIALVNGVLVDGTGAQPLRDAVVVIRDGKIESVGARGTVNIPENAQVIDAKGGTILPGFINAHVHQGFNEENLAAWAQAGVTTVRDLDAEAYDKATFAARDRINQNPRLARLIAVGIMVTVEDGYPKFWGATGLIVESPEDARRKINMLIDNGADVIKIGLEPGAIFGFIGLASWPMLSKEEVAAIVETAHRRGVPVSAHITQTPQLKMAVECGIDDVAHMVTNEIKDDKTILTMIQKGIYWEPTLELWEGVGVGQTMVYNNLHRFIAAGGKVALGTDFAGARFRFQLGMPIREMELMERAGMTPMQIIVAGTKNAAHVCNREKTLGTLEPGKIADVLIVDGDPLQDIHAMAKVRMVIKDGIVIRELK